MALKRNFDREPDEESPLFYQIASGNFSAILADIIVSTLYNRVLKLTILSQLIACFVTHGGYTKISSKGNGKTRKK